MGDASRRLDKVRVQYMYDIVDSEEEHRYAAVFRLQHAFLTVAPTRQSVVVAPQRVLNEGRSASILVKSTKVQR